MERVCPLLALASDARSVVEGVDRAHECHALAEPMPLERQMQSQLCLTSRHDRCDRYRQHVAGRGGIPGRAPLGDGLVSTRLILAPEATWRGIAGRARRGRSVHALGIGGAVVALALAGSVAAANGLGEGLSLVEAPATPTESPRPVRSVAPTPSESPTPTASPTPSPTPSASPTPTASPTPSPTPVPVRTYVVQEGDTLAAIAQSFGTTVDALLVANAIEDPDEIIIGQTLVIP